MRKLVILAAIFVLALALSCGAERPVPVPAPKGAQEQLKGLTLEVSHWEIENKLPDGLRLTVELNHKFPLDPEASNLEATIGDNLFRVAPEMDQENPNPDQIVFVIGGNDQFRAWTEIKKGKVQIRDTEGNEVVFETGPFTYTDPRFLWEEKESEHVKVFFYGSADKVNPEQILSEAENLLEKFFLIPSETNRIMVYETRRDINGALPFRSDATTKKLITEGIAFKEIDAVFVLRRRDLLNTTRHELMHLIFAALTEKVVVPLPTWLNEGLATYAGSEDLEVYQKRSISFALENGRLLSLRQLSSFSGRPEMVTLNYAEAHSFVRFLVNGYGQDTILGLLRILNENFGLEFKDAIEEAYGRSLDSLEKEWMGGLTGGGG